MLSFPHSGGIDVPLLWQVTTYEKMHFARETIGDSILLKKLTSPVKNATDQPDKLCILHFRDKSIIIHEPSPCQSLES